jgi:DNA-binding response OmpR family regulator
MGRARPDLVLLEVMLPDMRGVEVCRRIKADHSSGRAIVLLVSSDGNASESQVKALEGEADGCILGPIPDKALLARVHTLLRVKLTEEALERVHDELERRVREQAADLERANAELVRKEEMLAEKLRFEGLLVDISARFVHLPSDRIDGEIKDAQRQICELLDMDRSSLWQVHEGEPETLQLTHFHQPPGSLSTPGRMSLNEFWQWALQKILGGETPAISNIHHQESAGGDALS